MYAAAEFTEGKIRSEVKRGGFDMEGKMKVAIMTDVAKVCLLYTARWV